MKGPRPLPSIPRRCQDAGYDEQTGIRADGHVVAVGHVGKIQDPVDQGQANGAQGNDGAYKNAVDHQTHLDEGEEADGYGYHHDQCGRISRRPGLTDPSNHVSQAGHYCRAVI